LSDLHLTDNPKDEYRWGIFDFLKTLVYASTPVLILGDLTDAKDKHNSVLVNRIVSKLMFLSLNVGPVFILCGNHDYLVPSSPFFNFLNNCEDITFVTSPTLQNVGYFGNILFLPATPSPTTVWEEIFSSKGQINIQNNLTLISHVHMIVMHQTVSGAVVENGTAMPSGLPATYFTEKNLQMPVYSGDIHVPQKIGNIEYVGAPYPIHFGDKFKGRVICITNKGVPEDHFYETIQRKTIVIKSLKELEESQINPGDQIKIRVQMEERSIEAWEAFKLGATQWSQKQQAQLYGIEPILITEPKPSLQPPPISITPIEILQEYAAKRNVSTELLSIGKALITDVQSIT